MPATSSARGGRRTAPAVDWSLAPRGPVSATAHGALALAAAGVAGDLAGVHPVIGAAATGAAAVATVVRSAHLAHPPAALLYRLACTLGAGSWLTYVLTSGELWSQGAWAALGIGAAAAGIASPLGRAQPRPGGRPGTGRSLVLSRTARVGEEWARRIRRVCRISATVTDVIHWATGTGYDVHVDLPGAGTTRAQLAAAADALATDARLPDGCGVEVTAGAHRGAVILRVSTVNRLTETVPMPELRPGSSITAPAPLGEYRDGTPAVVHLRQASALITGQRGSGKTNLLHVLTAQTATRRDAIVWHIDLNGGGMSQPWLYPWLEGQSARPAVDWAAADPDEALALAEAALAIAKARKRYTRQLKIAQNASLMPVSPELPEIIILIDEGAEVLSPTNRETRALRESLEEIQRIGRNEAVNVVVSSLRATQDMISANVRKQSAVRIGMYVQDEEELAFLYGWNRGLSIADLPGTGCGFIQDGQGAPRPFRAYYMPPADIVDVAMSVARTRPDLDAAAAEAAGDAYMTRYERMRQAFAEDDGGAVLVPLPDVRPVAAPVASVPRRHLVPVPCGADAAAWPDLRDVARPQSSEPRRLDVAAAWPDLLPGRASQTEAAVPPAISAAAPGRQVPDILRRALAAFAAAGDDRMHSEALADALGMTPVELAAALREHGVTPLEQPFKRHGVRARGYALADVQAAVEGHTPGSQPGVTGSTDTL